MQAGAWLTVNLISSLRDMPHHPPLAAVARRALRQAYSLTSGHREPPWRLQPASQRCSCV